MRALAVCGAPLLTFSAPASALEAAIRLVASIPAVRPPLDPDQTESSAVFDPGSLLLEVKVNSQTVKEFSYDAAGRTTSITTSAGTTNLSWDYEDRLVGITYPNTSTNSFTYNAFGARVGKVDSLGTHVFERAGTSPASSILSDGNAVYTPGISERRNNVSRFYHFTGLGENGRETNTNEFTTSSRTWDAWGNPLTSIGSTSSPFGAFGGSGSETEFDSLLIHAGGGAFYDPSTGRFITKVRGSAGSAGGYGSPATSSGGFSPAGPMPTGLLEVAEGGGYVFSPGPREPLYGMMTGRLGYFDGSMERMLDDLCDSALYAALKTAEMVLSVLAIGAIAACIDDVAGIVLSAGRVGARPVAATQVVNAYTSNAARREAMRRAGVPTSQQPVRTHGTKGGMGYEYEVPAPGGGVRRVIINQHPTDPKHGPHWEAGIKKPGAGRTDPGGRPRYWGIPDPITGAPKIRVPYHR